VNTALRGERSETNRLGHRKAYDYVYLLLQISRFFDGKLQYINNILREIRGNVYDVSPRKIDL
jgi:hypothetical protein